MTFEAGSAAIFADVDALPVAANENFRTPTDPEAGWASRNPDRAMLFLFVSPRACGALDELMAL
jgi:metal-dependent amidase/aminoacylase/carboxypeptidase family protein